jgi:hypothetical protein
MIFMSTRILVEDTNRSINCQKVVPLTIHVHSILKQRSYRHLNRHVPIR